MYDFSLKLLCTSKPGTLSRLVREIGQVGMQYRGHRIEDNGKQSNISIDAVGDPNCTLESLEELFGNFPEVLEIVQLRLSSGGRDVTEFKTRVSATHVSATEQLTPAVVLAAEKRLSDILGPVASVIVETVAPQCRDAGELYVRLAAELNDDAEREYFLSIVDRHS